MGSSRHALAKLRRDVRGVLVAVFCVASSSVARSQTATVPARIVSTSPSITETLFALGLGDHVVGVSTFCRYPAEVVALPKVGTFLKPNPEAIARLKPDLAFVHSGPNTAASQLATLGIKTAVVDRGALPSVFTTIQQIGTAAGVADRADRLVRDLNVELARVKASVGEQPTTRVLIIVGRRVGTLTDIIAVGPKSYLSDVAAIAGGTNVMSGVDLEYPRISMETIIRLAPDVIIDVGEMGETRDTGDRRRAVTEGLWERQTLVKAARDHRVFAIQDEAFVVPGPRVVAVARSMAALFHPSAAK